MRTRLLLLIAGAAALFLLIALFKTVRPQQDEAAKRTPEREAERQRLAAFWKQYGDATAARMRGEFAAAAGLYEKALALKPDHEDSLYYLGNCFFETGDYRQAAERYRQITRMNPRSQRAFSQLGVTLSTLDPAAPFNPAEAEASFRKSIAINSEESGPFLRLGQLALNAGDTASALRQFRTAAGFRSPEGYFQAGSILFTQGRYQDAAAMFREVLRLNAREKSISGRGVLSEGDIRTSRKMLTPVEAAGVKALLYLGWTDDRLGGQAESADREFRIHPGNAASIGTKIVRVPAFDRLAAKAVRVAWCDPDGDGRRDAAAMMPEGRIELYRDANGTLVESGPRLDGVSEGRAGGDLAWCDYDGDGRPDLFVAGGNIIQPGSLALYRNTGHGFTDTSVAAGLGGKRITLRLWVSDLDLDGKPDLLEAGCAEGALPSVRFYRNLGKAGFKEWSRQAGLVAQGNATDCLVEDFNSDHLPDVVVMRWKLPPLLFLAVKPGQFASPQVIEKTPMSGYSCVTADFNRDSHLDLLFAAHAPYELAAQNLINPDLGWPVQTPRLLLGDGHGAFRDATNEFGLNHCFGVMEAAAADVDGDGWTDVVFANGGWEPNRLEPSTVLKNENGKGFRPMAYLPDIHHPVQARSVTICDSGDRLPEIWLAGVGVFEIAPPSHQAHLTGPRTH